MASASMFGGESQRARAYLLPHRQELYWNQWVCLAGETNGEMRFDYSAAVSWGQCY